jgi:hypothetical protein
MQQTEYLLATLTQIPDYLRVFGRLHHLGDEQLSYIWRGIVEQVHSGGKGNLQFADLGGGSSPSPMDMGGYTGAGFAPPTLRDRFLAKYAQMEYITSNMMNPSPAFAQQMLMAAIIPIAKQMIPNTVFTKAFITDGAQGEISKPYFQKKRHLAYQQGLAEEAQHNPPSEVATYDPILVTPKPWKRATNLDMIWIETMNFDVPADQLSDGGREMQVLFDNAGFRGLDSILPNYNTAPAAGTTLNGYVMDPTGTVMMFEAGRNPQVEDLNAANQFIRQRGFNPDLTVTSPFELGCLMSEQAILMAYAYGTREVQETGLVGQLVGNAVAWTPNLWQGGNASSLVIWVCDSDELARVVLGQPLGLWPDIRQRKLDFELYCRLTLFFRNANACQKLVYSNADAGVT